MILLNLDLINFHGSLFLNEEGIKYPDIKNMINITKRSRYIFISPIGSLLLGSTTTQNESIP
jgi:hypothetical protein